MYNYTLSLIAGLIAMCFVITSYFVPRKKDYLLLQATALFLLSCSYLFLEEYFATVAYVVSLIRVVIYYLFEKNGKGTPIYIKLFFALLVIVMYVVVNIIILKTVNWIDIICVMSNLLYTFIFGIRNLRLMRYVILIPTFFALLYNVLIMATVFVIVSYSFELLANVVSIIKFDVLDERKKDNCKNKEKY